MSRIFLSYARQDLEAATVLAEALSRTGHHVWWDRQLSAGARFSAAIASQLKEANAVIVLWTEAAIESAWVQDEAEEARDSGKLIPLVLGGIRPPLGFRQFHSIQVPQAANIGSSELVDEVLATISRLCGMAQPDQPEDLTSDHRQRGNTTVFVAPFVNMSGEPEQEYFSDGISEDIITDLSNVSSISVIPRNTAFRYKGQLVEPRELASKFGVSHVLEGSVRKAGDRLRITAQLVSCDMGEHLWAERFDRQLTDIFAVQDEISNAIVSALQIRLLPQERSAIESRGTSNVDAYELYLMGRQQWIGGTFGDLRRAQAIVRFCREATVLDRRYADAWALMALAQAELQYWHGQDEDALPAAERALEINPDIAEARCVKARHLEESGRSAEAASEMAEAMRLGPHSWEVNREAGRMLFRQGRIPEAIPLLEAAVAMMDTDWQDAGLLIACYRTVKDSVGLRRAADRARERAQREVAKDPTNAPALGMGALPLALLGEKDRARDWLRRALLLDPENSTLRYYVACALAHGLNDPDGALEVMRPYFEHVRGKAQLRHLELDDDFAAIRDDPRFKMMLTSAKQRLGMTS